MLRTKNHTHSNRTIIKCAKVVILNKKTLKIVVIGLALALIILQFIRPDQNNPAINVADTLESTTSVPEDVAAILKRSCNDCHSNTTGYPWYAQVSPFSWLLDDHIREGRNELNLSVWGTYETHSKVKKLEEICEQVQSAAMPLPSYLWIHRDAALREGEVKLLCDWAEQEKRSVLEQ